MTKNEFRQVVNFQSDCIRRQKAEIERLHEVINGFEEQSHKEFKDYMALSAKYINAKYENERLNGIFYADRTEAIKKIKSKAIKEFAEKLSDRVSDNIERSLDNPNGIDYYVTDVYETINNLVKEMTEQKG